MEGQELGRQLVGHDEDDIGFCLCHGRPYKIGRVT
jgi:hypothetical protein